MIKENDSNSAFQFHGNWQDFAKIAIVNLLLTIITLGFYRFWATTREREYLWSETQFIDERLEWTGTGKELFIGFLVVLLLIFLPFTIIQFIAQGAVLQGYPTLGGFITLLLAMMIFYLGGVAYFRALRYRLGRTYWHGIRGGSNEPGFQYGLSYMGKYFLGMITLYLLIPWAMVSLWNERWNHMSFGTHQFQSNAKWEKLMKRFMLFYIAPFVMAIGIGIIFAVSYSFDLSDIDPESTAFGIFIFSAILSVYLIFPIIGLIFYSKFFRVVVGSLRLHDLEFSFSARSIDWILLFLGNVALVVFTLGLGYIMIPYRNWKFFITHMKAYGEVNLDELTQSETERSKHGEGLLDAFDVGAI